MARAHRLSMTGIVIVCLLSTQLTGTLFASEPTSAATGDSATEPLAAIISNVQAPAAVLPSGAGERPALTKDALFAPEARSAHFEFDATRLPVNPFLGTDSNRIFKLSDANSFGGQIYQGRPYPMRHDTSIAALMIGAVATITGAAILVYANRPDCSMSPAAGGCGYGTKVVGTAVLSGGIVGLFVGALTW